ncbi:MAG TPA: Gfo/Idh/MocA family oxidoreductase [Chloroflexota bacterium]
MDRVRVALIGAGNLASRYHYPSIASFPDVEIAAVCDLVREKAEAVAARFGIPRVYADYQAMIGQVEPDAVYAIMPSQHVFEPAVYALKQGRHLFIEKPPGLTAVQTKALAHHAGVNRCIGMAAFQRRYIPALTALKKRLEERGPIHHAAVSFLKATRDLTQPAYYYGGVVDILTVDGIHAVDTMRYLCGGEVVAVASDIKRHYVVGDLPNHFAALVTFSTGATGVLQFSYVTGRRIFRAEFHGQNVTAYVDADRDAWIVADDGTPEVFEAASFGEAGRPETWLGFWHQNRAFIDCVKAGRQPTNSFADAVKSMELVDRIYHSQIGQGP